MKLKLPETNVSTSADFAEDEFGIGDMALVMEILRSKMYSVPIRTICQEVASNARDAHREVGKADVPIEIKLPNKLDPTFYVRDFGPGISPNRMRNIFMKYGRSTKRNDNTQTGGFGLGAKSPFSYVDTFCIESITPEDFEGQQNVLVKRSYVAAIDESRKGKMYCMSTEVTTEPQGTKIVVASKPEDHLNFEKWVGHVCKYWDVKPVIKGSATFKFEEPTTLVSGAGWAMSEYESDGHSYNSYLRNDNALAIIDGIQFPIRAGSLNLTSQKFDQNIQKILQYPVRLSFKVGELQLTANREEIDYQTETIERIKGRLRTFLQEFGGQFEKRIANAKNLFEASQIWGQTPFATRELLTGYSLKWQGIPVNCKYDLTGGTVHRFYKDAISRTDHATGKTFTTEVYRQERGYASLNFGEGYSQQNKKAFEDSIVCYDDTPSAMPSKARAITLLAADDKIKNVYVLHWRNDEDDAEFTKAKALREADFKKHNFDKMELRAISTVERTKLDGEKKGSTGPASRVKKFVPGISTGFSSDWNATWRDTEHTTAEGGVYVVLLSETVYTNKEANHSMSCSALDQYTKLVGPIYGVFQRYVAKLGDNWKSLEEAVKEKIDSILKDHDHAFAIACAIHRDAYVPADNGDRNRYGHVIKDNICEVSDTVLNVIEYTTLGGEGDKRLKRYAELGRIANKHITQCNVVINGALLTKNDAATKKFRELGTEMRELGEFVQRELPLLKTFAAFGLSKELYGEVGAYIKAKLEVKRQRAPKVSTENAESLAAAS